MNPWTDKTVNPEQNTGAADPERIRQLQSEIRYLIGHNLQDTRALFSDCWQDRAGRIMGAAFLEREDGLEHVLRNLAAAEAALTGHEKEENE